MITVAELWVNYKPSYIDLTRDLWELIVDFDPIAGQAKPPFPSNLFLYYVYLTDNGKEKEIYLSFHPKNEWPKLTISYEGDLYDSR
jgi:hypothetical protein